MQAKFSGKREIYIEAAEKYEEYIKLGILSPGEKLPSVRAAAQKMGINICNGFALSPGAGAKESPMMGLSVLLIMGIPVLTEGV